MSKSLDELYSASPESGPSDTGVMPEAPKQETEAAQAAAPKQDAEGQAAPPAAEAEGEHVPRAALQDERRKRQTVEGKYDELEKRFKDLERRLSQPAETETRKIDPLVDPEGFTREIELGLFNNRLELSTEFVRDKVGEEPFKQAEQAVLAVAQRNPQWAQEFSQKLIRHPNPGKLTYETGKAILEYQDAQDPVKARAKLREEIKAELRAELGLTDQQAEAAIDGQQMAQPPAVKPRVPTSLAGLQSMAPRSGGTKPIKRKSLDELYKT